MGRSSGSVGLGRSAAELLREARDHERAGALPEAITAFEACIAAAEASKDDVVLAEALRRLAIVRHHRDDRPAARVLCQRSLEVATAAGQEGLAAEALNTMGGLELTGGSLVEARRLFLLAVERGGESRELRSRVEQNLGIVANIQGELYEALMHYERSLAACRAINDEHGCAIAYHNLGMVSADRGQFDAAEGYFRESRTIAEKSGDIYLQGLCLANAAEIDVARQRYENAVQGAEAALALFDQLGAGGAKVDAYRVLGMAYRETARLPLAESRLLAAIDMAVKSGSVLGEAESSQELAVLYQAMGRNQDALRLLNAASRMFKRLDARVELVHVGGRLAELEGTYLAVVRSWGQSIEAADSRTFGHSERVAKRAVALARVLSLDDQEETTVLLGAYLHDVGKLRAPHELLRKQGPLTREERQLMQQHPVWGLELLSNVEFPWDIKPVIRWHHERYDGGGYPDRLKGDEIPLAAQIVGIVEVLDALEAAAPTLDPAAREECMAEMQRRRGWWSPRVFEAFLQVMAEPESPA